MNTNGNNNLTYDLNRDNNYKRIGYSFQKLN